MVVKSDTTNNLLANVVVASQVIELPAQDASFAELPPSF